MHDATAAPIESTDQTRHVAYPWSVTDDRSNNFVYVGKRVSGEIGYVGIGGTSRPYGSHNESADEVLRSGEVWVTSVPFSTRRDAEMAESLLVQALTWATEHRPDLTNIAKVGNTKHLIPSLRYREGRLNYNDVSSALFVKIRPGHMRGRTGPTGDSGDSDLTVRCNRWWGLGAAKRRGVDVDLLVAVIAKVRPARIIGVWRARPVSEWWLEDQANPDGQRLTGEAWNDSLPQLGGRIAKGWVVAVDSPDSDVNGWQGLEFDWQGYRPQKIGWSRDLRT